MNKKGEQENVGEEQDEIEDRMENNADKSNAEEEEEWTYYDAEENESEEGLEENDGTDESRENFEEPTIRESLVSNQSEDEKVSATIKKINKPTKTNKCLTK